MGRKAKQRKEDVGDGKAKATGGAHQSLKKPIIIGGLVALGLAGIIAVLRGSTASWTRAHSPKAAVAGSPPAAAGDVTRELKMGKLKDSSAKHRAGGVNKAGVGHPSAGAVDVAKDFPKLSSCLKASRSLKPWAASSIEVDKLLWNLFVPPEGTTVALVPQRALEIGDIDGVTEIRSGDKGVISKVPGDGGLGTVEVRFMYFGQIESWGEPIELNLPADLLVVENWENSPSPIYKNRVTWQVAGGLEFAQKNMPVLAQQDFLSEAELSVCLESLATVASWAGSEHISKTLQGSVESEQASNRRQSKTWWCDRQCQTARPEFGLLTQRISQQLGIHERYFENLQFVKYDAGDFYHVHSDHSQLTAYNPRMLTFLVYLQGPADGSGKTEFPNLGLKMTPRPGAAILWRDVGEGFLKATKLPVSEDLAVHASEVSTDVKIVTNVWVRMYPFEEMDAQGC